MEVGSRVGTKPITKVTTATFLQHCNCATATVHRQNQFEHNKTKSHRHIEQHWFNNFLLTNQMCDRQLGWNELVDDNVSSVATLFCLRRLLPFHLLLFLLFFTLKFSPLSKIKTKMNWNTTILPHVFVYFY